MSEVGWWGRRSFLGTRGFSCTPLVDFEVVEVVFGGACNWELFSIGLLFVPERLSCREPKEFSFPEGRLPAICLISIFTIQEHKTVSSKVILCKPR